MRNHFFSAAFSSLCWGEEEIGSNRSNLNVSPVIANQCEGTRLSMYRYDNWKKLSAKQIDGCAKNRTKWKLFWKEITFHSTENNEQLTANWKCDGHLGFDTKNLEFKTIVCTFVTWVRNKCFFLYFSVVVFFLSLSRFVCTIPFILVGRSVDSISNWLSTWNLFMQQDNKRTNANKTTIWFAYNRLENAVPFDAFDWGVKEARKVLHKKCKTVGREREGSSTESQTVTQ